MTTPANSLFLNHPIQKQTMISEQRYQDVKCVRRIDQENMQTDCKQKQKLHKDRAEAEIEHQRFKQ